MLRNTSTKSFIHWKLSRHSEERRTLPISVVADKLNHALQQSVVGVPEDQDAVFFSLYTVFSSLS